MEEGGGGGVKHEPSLFTRVYGQSCIETLQSRKRKSSGLSKKSSQPVEAISLYLCLFE